jgi:transmembrane sensor
MKVKAVNSQIYAEASEWLIEFRSGDIDVKGRKGFYDWLRTSPEHMRAYLELAAIWNEGTVLDSNRTFDDSRLANDVKSETNIIPLQCVIPTPVVSDDLARPDSSSNYSEASAGKEVDNSDRVVRSLPRGDLACFSAPRTWRRRSRVVVLVASLILASSSVGVWYVYARDTYSTSVGEDRMLTLSDGSTIELNASSRVRVDFSNHVRGVNLLQGQALFHVAKDHNRPFIVRTDNAQVRAVGTQFNVYRNRAATTVTVVEGTVAVLPAASSESSSALEAPGDAVQPSPILERGLTGNALMLSAGDQVTVAPDVQPKSVKADVTAATAWTQHELVFKGASLADVVLEFNRYNKRRLTIRDVSVANLKVTGIFSSTDPSSLIRFLKARPDIAVSDEGDEILIAPKF